MELTREELFTAAEYFGADYKKTDSKKTLVESLESFGVTIEEYNKFFNPEQEEEFESPAQQVKVIDPATAVLIRMDRRNPTYELRGYTFTQQHPFALTTEEDANWILENERGFRIASPKEAKEFYG
jgi:ribosomal protein S1